MTTAPPDWTDRGDDEIPDDRLRLIFTCAHPALSLEAGVALTLRTLAGLTTAEIARASLVPEPTMAQAPGPRETEDPARRNPLPGTTRPPAPGPHAGCAGGALPAVQRGILGDRGSVRGARRAVRRGDAAHQIADGADARRTGGPGAAHAAAAAAQQARRPGGRPRCAHDAEGAGPCAVGPGPRPRRGCTLSTARPGAGCSARINCRPRSPPATRRRPPPPTRTGRRSPSRTTDWRSCTPARWSR